jgi:hypothetical protein
MDPLFTDRTFGWILKSLIQFGPMQSSTPPLQEHLASQEQQLEEWSF